MQGEVAESLTKYASKWMYRPALVPRSLLSTTQVAGGQLVLKSDRQVTVLFRFQKRIIAVLRWRGQCVR